MGYDCLNCQSYCCSYPVIRATDADIRRLANHFEMSFTATKKKFTEWDKQWKVNILKSKVDGTFMTACVFLHPKARICTVYSHRPLVCKGFPGSKHYCGYYNFVEWERKHQPEMGENLKVCAFIL